MTDDITQQFCVKWNSHLGSLGAAFPQLLAGQRFVDVTLSCEGHQVRCHRLVLAACSSYFEQILGDNPCKHPVIILPSEIKLWEVQALVDFMYKGEVHVSQAGLTKLLKCAEILQIRGLYDKQVTSTYLGRPANSTSDQHTPRSRQSSPPVLPQQQSTFPVQLQSNSRTMMSSPPTQKVRSNVICSTPQHSFIQPMQQRITHLHSSSPTSAFNGFEAMDVVMNTTKLAASSSDTHSINNLSQKIEMNTSCLKLYQQNDDAPLSCQLNRSLTRSSANHRPILPSINTGKNYQLKSASNNNNNNNELSTEQQRHQQQQHHIQATLAAITSSSATTTTTTSIGAAAVTTTTTSIRISSNSQSSQSPASTNATVNHLINKNNNTTSKPLKLFSLDVPQSETTLKQLSTTTANPAIISNILENDFKNSSNLSSMISKIINVDGGGETIKSEISDKTTDETIASVKIQSSNQHNLSEKERHLNSSNNNRCKDTIVLKSKTTKILNVNEVSTTSSPSSSSASSLSMSSYSSVLNDDVILNEGNFSMNNNMLFPSSPSPPASVDITVIKTEDINDDVDDDTNEKEAVQFEDFLSCELNADIEPSRRQRRSEEQLRKAAAHVSCGETFQMVSDKFQIPISTIRFYMARKGILPRRKRGRVCGANESHNIQEIITLNSSSNEMDKYKEMASSTRSLYK